MPKANNSYDLAKAEEWPSHMEDFLNCLHTGGRPKCNIDEAFIEVPTALMSVEANRLNREVRWDAKKEEVT